MSDAAATPTQRQQRQQALAFFAAIDPPNYSALEDMFHDDFRHSFFPASLGGFGTPERSKAEFIAHVKNVVQMFERFNFQLEPPKDFIQGKGVNGEDVTIFHFVADGTTASGKPYANEYVVIFRFRDCKIVQIKEFMDSKYVTEMLGGEA